MRAISYKPLLLIISMFVGGYLAGQFWHYLGDKNNIINSYLEAHNSRFISNEGTSQIYYVFYNNLTELTEFVDSRTDFKETQSTSIDQVVTVEIDKSSLPDSLNLLRKQEFIRFVFPGTFPFICH